MSEVGKYIRQIAGKRESVEMGVVRSVDMQTMSCVVMLDEEGDEVLASLIVGEKNRGLCQVPKEGSMVAVLMKNEAQGVVVMVEEVEKIVINGGERGGLINIEELRDNLEKMTKRIDGIMNALKNSSTGTQDGGASYKAQIEAKLAMIVEKEDFGNIEDKEVVH
ncbi:MAG: hypothetical protein MJZ27_09930 [Bacteroidales bacterium]|nr:hypothetical protein [Bacteroidales bacterium]